MKQNLKFMMIGFIQLSFLSANTYFISITDYKMIFVSAIITNVTFAYAISNLAMSKCIYKIMYAMGCSFGCLFGTFIASSISKL